MNKFEAKELKISAKYLEEKLNSLRKEENNIFSLNNKKKESTIKKFMNSLFKSQ